MKELRANRIVLEDLKGNPRAALDASQEGLVYIQLHGAEQAGLHLSVESDGNPKVSITNKEGHTVLGLGLTDHSGHGFMVYDSKGRPVGSFAVRPDGIPRLQLFEVVPPDGARTLWSSPAPRRKRSNKSS